MWPVLWRRGGRAEDKEPRRDGEQNPRSVHVKGRNLEKEGKSGPKSGVGAREGTSEDLKINFTT